MKLLELFNTQVPSQIIRDRGRNVTTFEINGNKYGVWFEPSMDYDDAMEVSFGLFQGTNDNGENSYTQFKTGTGNEMSVFGAVLNIVREYIGMTNMSKLVFAARLDEPSRVNLYDRIISRIVPDWKLRIVTSNNYKTYILTNPHKTNSWDNEDAPD